MTRKTLSTGRRVRLASLAAAVASVGLLATACGSSSSSTAAGNSGPTSGGSQPVTVETHSGPTGTYLTDGSGKTLYLFANDKGKMSTCTGSCAHFWPPVTTKGSPKATGQARAGALATSKRTDGSTQVTYNGHPLYYFLEDQAAGDTKGQGMNQNGGLWWMVTPAGSALTKAAAKTQNSPSSGGGGGGGWS